MTRSAGTMVSISGAEGCKKALAAGKLWLLGTGLITSSALAQSPGLPPFLEVPTLMPNRAPGVSLTDVYGLPVMPDAPQAAAIPSSAPVEQSTPGLPTASGFDSVEPDPLLPPTGLNSDSNRNRIVRPITEPSGFVGSNFDRFGSSAEPLEGVSYSIGTTFVYDSNIQSGVAGGMIDGGGDTIWTVSPGIAYQNPGGDFTLGGALALNYSTYLNNSDLGGLGYTASIDSGYRGAKFDLSGRFESSLSRGNNRNFSNSFVETVQFTTGLNLDYTLSPKTKLSNRFAYFQSDPKQAAFGKTSTTTLDSSVLYQFSPLTSFGPGLSWSSSSGRNQDDRTSLGPIFRATYQVSRKVTLDGTIGLEFVDGSSGGDETNFTTSLSARYQASVLWGMNLSIYRGTNANGGLEGGFRETTSVRLGYTRSIRRATLEAGLGYEFSDTSGGGNGTAFDQNFFEFDTSIGMPIFANRANAAVFYSFRDQSGVQTSSLDGFQIGFRLSAVF